MARSYPFAVELIIFGSTYKYVFCDAAQSAFETVKEEELIRCLQI
jgi:hypothetical protein